MIQLPQHSPHQITLGNQGKILLCITGSIAAYKAADLISLLTKAGHDVQCLMTESASQFVSPLVLETLSGHPVLSKLFGPEVSGTEHIRLARWPDLIVVAPATAHTLAKISLGLADDLISTVILASRAPLAIAPAMNTAMWEHPTTQEHLTRLRSRGAIIHEPTSGTLACGEEGEGKLPSPESLSLWIEALLKGTPPMHPKPRMESKTSAFWKTQRVLITSGPTTSYIDAVRYLTNPSTGKMGSALAEALLELGAQVDFVTGVDKGVVVPRDLIAEAPSRLRIYEVHTAEEMATQALALLPHATGVIATAAVLDYRVATTSNEKHKRSSQPMTLELIPSQDVLATLSENRMPGQWFFGFAAETAQTDSELIHLGRAKLLKKKLDFLFVNPIATRDAIHFSGGFGAHSNSGFLLTRPFNTTSSKEVHVSPKWTLPKTELAHTLLKNIDDWMEKDENPPHARRTQNLAQDPSSSL